MTTQKFNRKYKVYQPSAADGPPTERICKRVKCDDDGGVNPDPPFDKDAMDEEIREAREWFAACLLNCESAYCQSKCNEEYQRRLQEIYDKYNYQP
jgi:aminoglycoside/choline kinase family phosphotransferase